MTVSRQTRTSLEQRNLCWVFKGGATVSWSAAKLDDANARSWTQTKDIARGVLQRGASLGDVGRELVPLGVFFMATLALAIARFRKRLD